MIIALKFCQLIQTSINLKGYGNNEGQTRGWSCYKRAVKPYAQSNIRLQKAREQCDNDAVIAFLISGVPGMP